MRISRVRVALGLAAAAPVAAQASNHSLWINRRTGVLHQSKVYPLATFSDAEWASEERERYLTELGKDVAVAEQKVKAPGP